MPGDGLYTDKYEPQRAKFDAMVAANVEASKKKKPASISDPSLSKVKDPVALLKVLSIPKSDKSNKIQSIAWAPAGPNQNRLAFARQDHFVGVMDVTKNCGVYGCKSPWTQCIALHPTRDIVLTGGMSNSTKMYQPNPDQKGELVEKYTWTVHDGYIASLKFIGANGEKYLSASGDADIRLFDVESKACLMCMRGHEKDAQSIEFPVDPAATSYGANTFATCSSDKTVKLWDLNSGKCCLSLLGDSELNACSIFPNGNLIAAGGEKDKTYVFDVRAATLVNKYARNNQKTASVCWSRSGRHLYVGHDDGALIGWDIFSSSGENKTYAFKIEAHLKKYDDGKPDITNSRIQDLAISQDGILASGGFDGTVKIWANPEGAA